MRILKAILATAVLLSPTWALAEDNARLVQLMTADQSDREGSPTPEQWQDIAKRDASRRAELMTILREGQVHSARDYFNAALIMQHGDAIEDIRMAHALATISDNLDPSNKTAAWLTAASWDRLLLRMHRPQWYGTQYVRDADGKWMLYEVDESAVTDADRQALSVPPLADAKKRVDVMNGAK